MRKIILLLVAMLTAGTAQIVNRTEVDPVRRNESLRGQDAMERIAELEEIIKKNDKTIEDLEEKVVDLEEERRLHYPSWSSWSSWSSCSSCRQERRRDCERIGACQAGVNILFGIFEMC